MIETDAGSRSRQAPVKQEKLNVDGLTSWQFRFVSLVFSGMANTEAYRAAYDAHDMADVTVKNLSANLASLPAVQDKVRALRLQVERQSTLSAEVSRNFVLNGLMRLATTAEKESVQLGAYQTLGKTVGIDLFRETVRHETVTRTVDDVEQELKAKLEQLRAGLTIEGKSNQVEDKPRDRRRKPVR